MFPPSPSLSAEDNLARMPAFVPEVPVQIEKLRIFRTIFLGFTRRKFSRGEMAGSMGSFTTRVAPQHSSRTSKSMSLYNTIEHLKPHMVSLCKPRTATLLYSPLQPLTNPIRYDSPHQFAPRLQKPKKGKKKHFTPFKPPPSGL